MMRAALISLVLLVFSTWGLAARNDIQAAAMGRAMQAVAKGDWAEASRAAAPAGKIGEDIVEWHRLRAGKGTFADYIDFLGRRPDWPGLPLLHEKGESAIPEGAAPDLVVSYFAKWPPRTGVGALRLAAAFEALGRDESARETIVNAWRTLPLDPDEETAMLERYGEILVNHHRARQDMLLWRGLTTQAERLNPLVGTAYVRLAAARVALIKGKKKGVDALIGKVPEKLADDPGLAYARFIWRLKNGQRERAAELLLERSTSVAALGRPERWADRRRSLARELVRRGKAATAYRVAANHFLTEGDSFKDLEWLAGHIALTKLNDPGAALRHFRRFRAAVNTPISLGRAGYWEGRALEALGDQDGAQLAYEFGGEFQTSFYGQLAAEKAGLPMDPGLTGRESYPDFLATPHADGSLLAAALLMQKAGYSHLFKRFTRQLAESLDPDEQGALAQLALELEETHTALYLAKYAATGGVVLARPYFPAPDVLVSDSPVPAELALSVIRRESEFQPEVTSRAGARGLMQLMPGTAREVAKRQGLPFDLGKLTSDPAYNARLGTAYLDRLMEEFDGYLPLVAAAYNAGPNRAKAWLKEFGDPRRSPEAAVDWIETIPFRETRNYVMRVMESLAVYRARLTGETSALRLSRDLTGG